MLLKRILPVVAWLSIVGVLFAQAPGHAANLDPISGGAGWVGAGLLGAVLGWLLLVHLPSKDKQVKEMIAAQLEERNKWQIAAVEERILERTSRHAVANMMQDAIAKIVADHHAEMMELQNIHSRDAEKDRDAFLNRTQNTRLAIELQTKELIAAIEKSCKFK